MLLLTNCSRVLQGADQLKSPIHITPARASKSAIQAVEKLGGSVFCKYYNALALKDCVKGRTDRTEAAPVRQTDICESRRVTASFPPLSPSFQCGIRTGTTGVTSHLKLWPRCPLPFRTLDGKSCPSSSWSSEHKNTTVPNRYSSNFAIRFIIFHLNY